jgi:hypothetical protein
MDMYVEIRKEETIPVMTKQQTNIIKGAFKFQSLIEKYALFNNIRKEELARKGDEYLYNTTAYNIN